MISFFFKKRFLIDYLGNFVDIHNHILPGIDDGADSPDTSIKLIQGFAELGITKFIATPHIMAEYYPNNRQTIEGALETLREPLLLRGLSGISIEAAAEHMIDDAFEGRLAADAVLPIRQQYLLVEMSYLQPSLNFDEAIIQTSNKGFHPILAHPERYAYLHTRMKKYFKYKERGILMQLNLLSLGKYYGSQVYKTALTLLEEGLIDFCATDLHNEIHLQGLREITLTRKQLELIQPVIRQTIEVFY